MVSIRRRRQSATDADRNIYLGHISNLGIKLEKSELFVQKTDSTVSHVEAPKSNLECDPNLESQGRFSMVVNASSKDYLKVLFQEREFKRRKHQKRKQQENREPCTLRGVYYKNMKWQAAIKVGKKQVHLGTVGSQEEAAHLYDRAAYMCGREPNFELSEEEKQELQSVQWEEFLALTRKEIANKKMQNKLEAQMKRKQATAVNGAAV
ncbi:hypothetical protein O6H91_04G094200 [Diphasiastrum complanatum]|uniref:Uncharacterized protein n=1 Tax=Diphasiastrum complanatum TaxID=34168 RepID=A0ACC2DZK9_DIPCM|nr:hypothetical protein O6H91_04G094200 [Diphasiastrum complanatum]